MGKARSGAIADTFMRHVRVMASGCWEWTRAKSAGGYGLLYADGKIVRASRFSYSKYKGPIPTGAYVLHTCDNRLCVKPVHLFLGTAKSNAQDREDKGRGRKDRRNNGTTKITGEDAAQVRHLRKTTRMTLAEIGALVGLRRSQVGNIVRGTCW